MIIQYVITWYPPIKQPVGLLIQGHYHVDYNGDYNKGIFHGKILRKYYRYEGDTIAYNNKITGNSLRSKMKNFTRNNDIFSVIYR